jgi:hypothetical protein
MRPAFVLAFITLAAADGLAAQIPGEPTRRLTAEETGCDSSTAQPTEPVFEQDSVDQPVRPRRLAIEGMPIRIREVLTGRSVFRFVIASSGQIERCTIELVEETARAWSDAVLKELRVAHYGPAKKDGRPVRQMVYQVFNYHSDGRLQKPR